MNEVQIAKQLKKIRVAFPRQKYYETKEDLEVLIDLWKDSLGYYTDEVVSMAIRNYIQENTYAPTIADIKKELTEIKKEWQHEISVLDEWIQKAENILKCDNAPRKGDEEKDLKKWKEEKERLTKFKLFEDD